MISVKASIRLFRSFDQVSTIRAHPGDFLPGQDGGIALMLSDTVHRKISD
jgi:hypothetical protein